MDRIAMTTENYNYHAFLTTKRLSAPPVGFDVDSAALHAALFPFQRDIVRWALRRGRAALFEGTGLGKTLQQLVWAEKVAEHTALPVLILAPLAVAQQTVREGERFGIAVHLCREQGDVRAGINIANYERLHLFDPTAFGGIVLDESSILKAFDGKTRNQIIESFASTPYKLACTATPAPNDYMELGNHAEFLGVMSRVEMLAMFFVHDGGETQQWRLKGHAEGDFWQWLASWSVMLRNPSDLSYDGTAFILPPLVMHHHRVTSQNAPEGFLFAVEAQTLIERRQARKASLGERVAACAALVNETNDPWIVWCDLNAEQDTLARVFGAECVSIGGSTPQDDRVALLDLWLSGQRRILISKPSIFGFGLNFQHCAHVAFVGLSDSWEAYYQAIRRCWRFGQTRPVQCHVIAADTEGAVVANIDRKERDAERMAEEMVKHMGDLNRANLAATERMTDTYTRTVEGGRGWTAHLGDCIEVVRDMAGESIDYSIFSPPFASLYTYSNSPRDMGNCKTHSEFYAHFTYLVRDLFRVLRPGRLLSFHCTNIPLMKSRDGVIGINDFRGDLIRMFTEAGFIFHSEVCIWKDPVTAMQRTKAIGLLYKQLKKDSALSRQGIPDYLVTMRKPGENTAPVTKTPEDFPVSLWQRYASPVWMDINPSDTLQKESAREHSDERHIAPLQLEVIRRAVALWTNPDDLVLSPFAGIGSEGVVALEEGRRFVGVELKGSYYAQCVANLRRAESVVRRPTLFDLAEEVSA
jgi:hypothetical protein